MSEGKYEEIKQEFYESKEESEASKLGTETLNEIWDTLTDYRQAEREELLLMIEDIEDKKVREKLLSELENKDPAEIRSAIYFHNRITEEWQTKKLYDNVLKGLHLTRSEVVKEIEANDNIESEDESAQKCIVLFSWKIRPSVIWENIEIFRDVHGRELIYNWLKNENNDVEYVMEQEIPSYLDIKKFSDGDVKDMMIICVDAWFSPTLVLDSEPFFQAVAKSWSDYVKKFKRDIQEKNGTEESIYTIPNVCTDNTDVEKLRGNI